MYQSLYCLMKCHQFSFMTGMHSRPTVTATNIRTVACSYWFISGHLVYESYRHGSICAVSIEFLLDEIYTLLLLFPLLLFSEVFSPNLVGLSTTFHTDLKNSHFVALWRVYMYFGCVKACGSGNILYESSIQIH